MGQIEIGTGGDGALKERRKHLFKGRQASVIPSRHGKAPGDPGEMRSGTPFFVTPPEIKERTACDPLYE